MKSRGLFVACALASWSALGADQKLPDVPATPPAGSVQLWNGHDLTGWVTFLKENAKPPENFWMAKDGVLGITAKITGYLRTEKKFANYHLHAEWRWPEKVEKANSGVFVHEREPDVVWPYSVQINFKTNAAGDLIPQAGFLFGESKETVKKLAAPNEKPVGEWNGCDIFCREDSIEVFINGVRQNFVEKLSAHEGQVALQLEGTPIDFQNVWLQPL